MKKDKLAYFNRKTDLKPIKIIPLFGSQIKITEEFQQQKFCFCIEGIQIIYYLNAKNDEERKIWINKLQSNTKDFIKLKPLSMQHKIHIIFDEKTGKLKGISKEWENRIENSDFKKEELLRNSVKIVNVLNFEDNQNEMEYTHRRKMTMKIKKKHPKLEELCKKDDPLQIFEKLKKIGEGSFGMVYMATNKLTREKVAIKKMEITQKEKENLESELYLQQTSSDPNIVPVLGAYINNDELWVILELLQGGALTDILLNMQMAESEMAYVTTGTIKALSYLHSHNRIHRDIKSDNVISFFCYLILKKKNRYY